MIAGINSSLSALNAFSLKQQSNANNVANVNTDGFKKSRATLETQPGGTVQARVTAIETPGPLVYESTPSGSKLVEKSNVEISEEIPQSMLNRRFYQANVKMMQSADEMLGSLLDIKT